MRTSDISSCHADITVRGNYKVRHCDDLQRPMFRKKISRKSLQFVQMLKGVIHTYIQHFMLAFRHKSGLKLDDKVVVTDVKITDFLKT